MESVKKMLDKLFGMQLIEFGNVSNVLMRKISDKTRKKLLQDKTMKICAICGSSPTQWHHAIENAGRQLDSPWAIIGLCAVCHAKATPHSANYDRCYEKFALCKVLNRATDEELLSISKVVNYLALREKLNKSYG